MTEGFVRSFADGAVLFRVEEAANPGPAREERDHIKTYAEVQREYFSLLLQICGGRISGKQGAATLAGLKPNTLRAKLDKLNVPYGNKVKYK